MDERRKHTRLKITLKAEVTSPTGEILTGSTRTISFGGVFVEMASFPEIDEEGIYVISLILQEGGPRITIDLSGRAVHASRLGIGFQYVSIDAEHYTHFKNLMVANSPDPETLLEELERYPGLEVK